LSRTTRLFAALLLCLAALGTASARADDAATEKEVRTRREALTKAVNAHDAKEVKSFLDPSFVAETKTGEKVDYKQVTEVLDQLFQGAPDFKETIKIEKVAIKEDQAEITVRSTDTFTGPDGKKVTEDERALEIWKKTDGKWLLVHSKPLEDT